MATVQMAEIVAATRSRLPPRGRDARQIPARARRRSRERSAIGQNAGTGNQTSWRLSFRRIVRPSTLATERPHRAMNVGAGVV
ncbi:hypothetical protein AKJ09_08027 [Labilithrix luteola]|uniref:Uncharacterized protein n=1 Tax=Labilithrix luteola TaxID=1391654 RepID=A0A0K1Q6M4_9BACT|nr:hypothetical protein AKJ09_08027 [Labilithrix luteola]